MDVLQKPLSGFMCPSDAVGKDVNDGSERDIALDGPPPQIINPIQGHQDRAMAREQSWLLHGRTMLATTRGMASDEVTMAFCG